MTPLRVLLPLALLVAITLAEYPSSNQFKLYGKENDITLPGNPAIQGEDGTNGHPVVADDKNSKNEPGDSKGKPGDSDNKPGDSKGKPGDSDNKPADSNAKPGDSDTKPGDSKGKPGDSDNKPADSNAKPGDSNTKPGDSNTKPGDSNTKPGDSDTKPGDSNTKPGDSNTKPGDSNTKPGDSNTKPGDSNTKPGDSNTKPGDSDTKPGDSNTKPGDSNTKPGDSNTKPGDSDTKPGDSNTKPGDSDTKPGDSNTKPGDSNTKPGDSNAKPGDGKESTGYRLPETIKPVRYSIDLTVNQNDLSKIDSKYDGSVSIDISIKEETDVIKLHYDRRSITIKTVELVETEKRTPIEIKEKPETDLDKSICELVTGVKLQVKKAYILTLKFVGTVNNNSKGFYKGSYFNEDGKRRWYAVTHFEPLGARSAFPCFDEPAMKAEFSITITHSSGYTAISNMPTEKVTDAGKNWKKTIFETTPPMSTYLVAFAITDFEKTSKKPAVYSRKDAIDMAEYAALTGELVLKELETYTNIKFQLPKMEQIALPLLKPGAMENWGLVTYRETALLYDENVNATIDQQKVASIIAHEFAHQWFGNMVSPKWWKYIWLNEGFATYFQYYIADKINPKWHFMDQLNVDCLQGRAFVTDADWAKTRPMDHEESNEEEIGDMFDDIAYQKAASVIRMFVHVLGEDNFQKGIRKYLNDNQGKAVTSADLFTALDEVAKKKSLPDDVKLSTIFGDWATKKGYPVITVTKKAKSVTVKQEPFYFVEPETGIKDVTWYIPLNYVQENSEQDFDDTSVQEWLIDDSKTISNIDKDGWIIFNKKQTGYYRVNYDKANWVAIATYLQGDNYTTIDVLNRAQLVDDALNLAFAGKLDYDVALNLLAFLEHETEYIVWKSAFANLATLKKLLAPTEYYSEFSKFLVTVTDNLMENVTYTATDEEDYLKKLLRVDAVKWACDSGSQACISYAKEEVNKWLTDPYNNATLPRSLEKILLCGALKNYTFEEWNSVFVKYAGSTKSEEKALILPTLGCSSSPETLNYLLNLTIHQDSIFKGLTLDVLKSVYSNSAVGVQVTLDFISQNIDKLLTYDAHFYDNLEKYVNELGSRVVLEDDVTKLREIIATEIIPAEKTKGALDTAERNVKWLKKNGKEIDSWFATYNTVTESPPPEVTTKKGNGAGSLSLTTFLLATPLLLARLR